MVLGVHPFLCPDNGGVYQYSLAVLEALEAWRREGASHELCLVGRDDLEHPCAKDCIGRGCKKHFLRAPEPRRGVRVRARRFASAGALATVRLLWNAALGRPVRPHDLFFRPDIRDELRAQNIDFMLYPVPVPLCFEAQIPFVAAIHDLQHRLQPRFPEVGEPHQWAARERIHHGICRFARGVLVDSVVGKEDVLACYQEETAIAPERITVLPFVPAPYLTNFKSDESAQRAVQQKYDLPADFFFYPAQFWSHKNHIGLLRALQLLRDEHNLRVHLTLCGSHSGADREQVFQECQLLIEQHELESQVSYLGFVPDEEIAALYQGARALVMPTFFGPTNIPVLEAWSLDCPVLTSDLRGIREQCGAAALLCDPNSPASLAKGMKRLWQEAGLRDELRAKGRARLASYSPQEFRTRLVEGIERAIANKKP